MVTIDEMFEEQRKVAAGHHLEALARHRHLVETLAKNERLLKALGTWVPAEVRVGAGRGSKG